MDEGYVNIEECDAIYKEYSQDTTIAPCEYALLVPHFLADMDWDDDGPKLSPLFGWR